MLNETHDPGLRSWVESAQTPGGNFPIQNLPYGMYSTADDSQPRVGVAIGDFIFDLREIYAASTLNALMALSASDRRELRARISQRLAAGAARQALTRISEATMYMPATVGDYTDFYASIEHATNVGKLFRPDTPLLPNYKWVPIGYHGRSSSIVVSGTPVTRPMGQILPSPGAAPVFAASKQLDYELELGLFVGPGNAMAQRISPVAAIDQIFGLCLLNDWSARDIQAWEYQPLGPFLGKNFATSISSWVVTSDALEPFRVSTRTRAAGDPEPLPYLQGAGEGAYDVWLDVFLRSTQMREEFHVSTCSSASLYWSFPQLIAHHTSNGCPLRAGDLLGSGTISGEQLNASGCLLERTRRGAEPLVLNNGEKRAFLEDGDEVVFRGHCQREGFVSIGFGECAGMVRPAQPVD